MPLAPDSSLATVANATVLLSFKLSIAFADEIEHGRMELANTGARARARVSTSTRTSRYPHLQPVSYGVLALQLLFLVLPLPGPWYVRRPQSRNVMVNK